MPVMDEFKEERAALKHGTPKQKFTYFMDYYKWPTIAVIAVIIFAGSLAYHILTQKETGFYATLVNGIEYGDTEGYKDSFVQYAGIDTDTYDVFFDTSLRITHGSMDQDTVTSVQKLMVYIAASEIDIVVSDADTITQYAYSETFYDLREILTPEQIAKYEPYFFYADHVVTEEIDAAQSSASYDYTADPTYPDPKDPEAMRDPIPVGIFMDASEGIGGVYYFSSEEVVITVPLTTKNLDAAIDYIEFAIGL